MSKKMCISFLFFILCLNFFAFQALAQEDVITSNGKLSVDSANTTKDYFEVSASDLWYMGWYKADSYNDAGPYFAVYKTSDGPDSAKWFSMQKDSGNIYRWSSKVYFSDFNNSTGEYTITVYQNGITNYQGQVTTRAEYFLGELKVNYLDAMTSTTSTSKSNFNVYARNFTNVQGLFYGVWRSEDGIDTAQWFAMTKDSSGQYVGNVDIQNFNYEVGEYQVNVFKTNLDGSDALISNAKVNVNPVTSESESINGNSFPVYAYKINPNLTSAYFAVWNDKDGIDTAKWYGMTYDDANKRWGSTVSISNISNHDGVFYVNVYGKITNENDLFLGQVKINVNAKQVPVLMYHEIGNPNTGAVSATDFKQQMQYLKDNGYTMLTFDQIDNYNNYQKPIIVTFDDGYANNVQAYEVLQELQTSSFKPRATIFMIGSYIDNPNSNYLSASQMKNMSDSGIISFQSHTYNHVDLRRVDIDTDREYTLSAQKIYSITNKPVYVMAYPVGGYNLNVIEHIKNAGYLYAVTTDDGKYTSINEPDKNYKIKRIGIYGSLPITEFAKKIE